MRYDLAAFAAALFLVFVFDGLLSAAWASLTNCHAPALRMMETNGVRGAGRALGLASEATSLLISFSAVQYIARLAAVALALIGLWQWAGTAGSSAGPLSVLVVVVAVGLLAPIVELAGESLALRSPERTACALSLLGAAVVLVAAPVRWAYSWLARAPSGRRAGVVPPLVTEEEIKTIVDAGEEGGAIEVDEKEMIYSIFELGDTLVREVMIPRIDITAFEESRSLEDVADALLGAGHSRAPVYRVDIDHIVGIVYVRDLLQAFRQGRHGGPVSELLRPALFVPEAKKADDLLTDLQARRIHMAVVVDEYGGTAGLVTLEDLVEEIVGEIRDEYDAGEEAAFQDLRNGEFLFTGRIDLDEVNQLTGVTCRRTSAKPWAATFRVDSAGAIAGRRRRRRRSAPCGGTELGAQDHQGARQPHTGEPGGGRSMSITPQQREDLVRLARQARGRAYAPYSDYPVGAAVQTKSGRVFTGVNVENAAYPSGICAERAAVFNAVGEGEREIAAIAVATENGGSPCGGCRQVLSEFGPQAEVILVDGEGRVVAETTVTDLLPRAFGAGHLPKR
jgi:homotetrameric cytidine deaminase